MNNELKRAAAIGSVAAVIISIVNAIRFLVLDFQFRTIHPAVYDKLADKGLFLGFFTWPGILLCMILLFIIISGVTYIVFRLTHR